MNSLVFYGLIAYFAHRHIKNKWGLAVIDITAASLVLWIGFSRIYLGAHYPTDVLAGFTAGSIILLAATPIFRKSSSVKY